VTWVLAGSGGDVALGVGAVMLMGLCCGGPALIASGALGVLGRLLGNPAVIVVAVVVGVLGVVMALRRSRAGTGDCCDPETQSRHSKYSDRDATR
jgi:hypothetical protein